MKGLFIPEITAEMFRNGCLESIEALMAEGKIYDIDYEPEQKTGKWKGYNADNQNWLRTDGSPVFLICSECGQVVVNNFSAHWNYCSNCGCKMEVEE